MENTSLGNRSIEKDLFIKATPERVFQALTEKDSLEHWFMQKAEIDLRPGGAIRFDWGPNGSNYGNIRTLERPHQISYTWEAETPNPTTVTFDLMAQNGGTRLHLNHAGFSEREGYYSDGWNIHLQCLVDWLETGTERTW